MSQEKLREFLLKGTNWDGLINEKVGFDEIDEETVKLFIRMAKNKGRLTIFDENTDLKTIFEHLKLYYVPPSSSLVQDTGLSSPQQRFKSAWGHFSYNFWVFKHPLKILKKLQLFIGKVITLCFCWLLVTLSGFVKP